MRRAGSSIPGEREQPGLRAGAGDPPGPRAASAPRRAFEEQAKGEGNEEPSRDVEITGCEETRLGAGRWSREWALMLAPRR